jgi:hypothetical protein
VTLLVGGVTATQNDDFARALSSKRPGPVAVGGIPIGTGAVAPMAGTLSPGRM